MVKAEIFGAERVVDRGGCFWSSSIIRECNSRSCFQMTNIAFVIFNAQQLLSMESPMKERRIENFVSSLRHWESTMPFHSK